MGGGADPQTLSFELPLIMSCDVRTEVKWEMQRKENIRESLMLSPSPPPPHPPFPSPTPPDNHLIL